ncbi:polyamine ABC transporter substrate-binding protein [Leucobacter massiliensis]|uniref:Polyamine ABC transporter substrate-binding protein n=1 Tax=Leucobacter massiliensis TaxID=1686285 RepID=A0A2S9QM80_9MICO|nr:spermidine/putrescine ABC transporter substrate-binding protein [Leucobacter massiliensis]PRI10696.1 polyamine ABC transporter substrate-binding protein [Leucobacter massiliensis]
MPRQPEDPIVRSIVSMIRGAQLSRRQLLRGAAVGAAGAGALSLASCGTGGGGGGGEAGTVTWANWTYYMDFDEASGTWPSLEQFSKETGIAVDYLEDIDDNNTFFGKIKDALQLGQDTGYDTVTFTDWMNGRLVLAEQVQEFDYANLPNVEANLIPAQRDALDVDPGRKYTIPWQMPTTGWAWNKEAVPNGLKTLDDFLAPELKGKVGVLTEMRDTMGLILSGLGYDPSGKWGDKEYDEAIAWLDDAIQSGQITQVKGNSYTQDLETGATLAAFVWTGDVVMLNAEQDDQWTVEFPESGGMIASDSFTVPNGTSAEQKKLVEELINFYYQPDIAAQVADYVQYVTPVQGAQEAMEQVNPDNVDNPAIFPSETDWQHLHAFRTLTAEEDNRYSEMFQKVMGL